MNFPLESETSAALEPARRPPDWPALWSAAAREDQRIVEAAFYPRLDLTLFGRYVPRTNLRQPGAPSTTNLVSSEILAGAAYTWRVIDNGKVERRRPCGSDPFAKSMNCNCINWKRASARELAGLAK